MQRFDFFFRQKVEEGELDAAFQAVEDAVNRGFTDLAVTGVVAGLDVVQQASPNLTVQVQGPGVAYDQVGQRMAIAATQNVDCSVDENAISTAVAVPGNTKWLSIFMEFDRTLTDPRLDGNASTVYYDRAESFVFHVAAGAESVTPTRPALRGDQILLADVLLAFGQTTIVNANISVTRRQDAFVIVDTPRSIVARTVIAAVTQLLGFYNDHVSGVIDQHAASALTYGGGGAWADGTTNPATTVEAQLDKVISDLSPTAGGSSGARKIGIETSSAWADATTIAATNLRAFVDAIITNLASTGANDGAGRVGVKARGNWADGTTNPIATVYAALNKIVSDLATQTNPSGAQKIGIEALANWADGNTNPAASVYGMINTNIILKLAATTASNSGAAKIGIDALANWANGTTNPAGTLRAVVAKLVTDLASVTGDSGAHKIGIDSLGNWADATASVAAGVLRTGIAKIVSDLAGSAGTAKVGGAAMTSAEVTIAAGTLLAQLTALVNAVNAVYTSSVTGRTEFMYVAPTAGSGGLRSITGSSAAIVAVGDGGNVHYSTNEGLTWATTTAGAGIHNLVRHDSTNAIYVAIGAAGSIYTAPAATPGTWTSRTSGVAGALSGLHIGGPIRLIAGGAGGALTTSPDGVTWTSRTFGSANAASPIGGSGSVSIAGDATNVRSSTDGITWTARTLPSALGNITAILYTGTTYLAASGTGASTRIHSSPDGVTWTARDTTSNGAVVAMASNGSGTVIALTTTAIRYSTDHGVTWNTATIPTALANSTCAVYDATRDMFYVGAGPGLVLRSRAGRSWILDRRGNALTGPVFDMDYNSSSAKAWMTVYAGHGGATGSEIYAAA